MLRKTVSNQSPSHQPYDKNKLKLYTIVALSPLQDENLKNYIGTMIIVNVHTVDFLTCQQGQFYCGPRSWILSVCQGFVGSSGRPGHLPSD